MSFLICLFITFSDYQTLILIMRKPKENKGVDSMAAVLEYINKSGYGRNKINFILKEAVLNGVV
ncbi:hypothetical protein [Peribacillus muralis]|uniref:hypothetical protein n=1 Tax=Peribacillus muralis TaxID=264697 RepID=UPI00366C4A11